MKETKGITLVALIITIVVLLILAVISIKTIQNDGILDYANSAATKYQEGKKNEANTLLGYESWLNRSSGNDSSNNGREGTIVKYDSDLDGNLENWIVITDIEGKLEIISQNVMGSLPMGFNDTRVSVTTDLSGDGEIDADDIMIASYNNAITTINNYCKSLIRATDNDGVRTIGNSTETSELYKSTYFNNLFPKVSIKAGDKNYLNDYEKLSSLGIIGSNAPYYIASREIKVTEQGFVQPIVNMIGANGKVAEGNAISFHPDGTNIGGTGHSYGVRPIVINPENIEY